MRETLKHMNKGAEKVKSISGSSAESLIFNGAITLCLKDVQPSAMGSVGPEFTDKLIDLVQNGENFVSSIYGGSVLALSFPPLCKDFYRTLEKVCILVQPCALLEIIRHIVQTMLRSHISY